jgi:uncharacterized membrane protein
MKRVFLTAALGAAALGLAACNNNEADDNAALADGNEAVLPADEGNGGATAAADSDWPQGARVVEENGVTWRVDADGTRVRLDDVRIVTESGVRYRVRNDGTRVRIDERGLDVDLDGPDIPGVDVDVGTNRDGNLDVDVNTNGADATPNR